ncbi:hypothetical protein PAXINDRAFT_163694 [Paxillus involutus ATCC 200175]|uniref:Uncharacterized protein n=1 Tax=Paxillus involutus ATCC 200175 TaxID=664439 RepID=A0A0C9SVN3_PAXIN|nr:hypothetical protein PAXINDRAFT_163694 [Paxillus involutus ATCC 200175]
MNQNNTNDKNDGVKHSQPIPITTHFRHRSASLSSDSSSSPSSPPPLQTPRTFVSPRIPTSPPSSPILSFLSQSPAKSSATAPFRAFGPPPVFEDDEEEAPATANTRRGNTAARFNAPAPVPEVQYERGVNLLRRLSLGSALSKPTNDIPRSRTPPQPQAPPNSAVTTSSPIADHLFVGRRPRRSATIAEPGRQRRAPSPMGERILKGHFDGFN